MTTVGHGPRVLWVTTEPPDRSLGGGNIRQSYLFEALARTHRTDLLVTGRVRDARVRAAADQVIELSVAPPRRIPPGLGGRSLALGVALASPYPWRLFSTAPARRTLERHLAARADAYDLVCVEHAELVPLGRVEHSVPWVITLHHLFSGMMAAELDLARGRRQRWFRSRDLRKALGLERRAVEMFDRCLVCAEEDAARLRATAAPQPDRIAIVPNGVDLEAFTPQPLGAEPRILLPGTLAWGPNVDAARWLAAEIWPRIRAEIPEAELVLAGRAPAPDVIALSRLPGITVDADVPSMAPYLARSRVVLVPLRVGTGTRLKALEAMAAGRPVVGTTIGLEGIGVVNGDSAVVADTAEDLAAAVIGLLRDDDRAQAIARAGRALVESRFGWDRVGADFVVQMTELIRRSGRGCEGPLLEQPRVPSTDLRP